MLSDPASVALIAIAAICATLATVGLLARVQQARFARRGATSADRALLREHAALRDELAALIEQLDQAVDRLNACRPADTQLHATPDPAPRLVSRVDDVATLSEADVPDESAVSGADECRANLRRFTEAG